MLIERDIASLHLEAEPTVEAENKVTVLYASDEGDFSPAGDDMNASARVFLQDTVNQVKTWKAPANSLPLGKGKRCWCLTSRWVRS